MKTRIQPLTLGLHCKACDCRLGETCYDTELCNTCMEAVWETMKDIEYPDEMSGEWEEVSTEEEYF